MSEKIIDGHTEIIIDESNEKHKIIQINDLEKKTTTIIPINKATDKLSGHLYIKAEDKITNDINFNDESKMDGICILDGVKYLFDNGKFLKIL